MTYNVFSGTLNPTHFTKSDGITTKGVNFPFPQIDIIGAMVIVWRVRGKIIRSVLCSIMHCICVQCNAHTYEHI